MGGTLITEMGRYKERRERERERKKGKLRGGVLETNEKLASTRRCRSCNYLRQNIKANALRGFALVRSTHREERRSGEEHILMKETVYPWVSLVSEGACTLTTRPHTFLSSYIQAPSLLVPPTQPLPLPFSLMWLHSPVHRVRL